MNNVSTNDVVLLEVDEVLLEVDVNVVMKSFSPPSFESAS